MAPSKTIMVLVHGGPGGKRPSPKQRSYLTEALALGIDTLKTGGSAIDSVQAMIGLMEHSGEFNAGLGSRRQLDGVKRMDAAIMDGSTLQAGAVANIENTLHPIRAARLVMEQTDHVLLVGRHAIRFARHWKLQTQHSSVVRKNRRTSTAFINKKHGKRIPPYQAMDAYDTVGAIARDENGFLASGSSTGESPRCFQGEWVILPWSVAEFTPTMLVVGYR